MCVTCGVNQRLKPFSLRSSTRGFILEISCAVLISPLGRSYFWRFYGGKSLPVCPWSVSRAGIARGIPTASGDADGGLAAGAKVCLERLLFGHPSHGRRRAQPGLPALGRGGREMAPAKQPVSWLRTRIQLCRRSPVQATRSCGQ